MNHKTNADDDVRALFLGTAPERPEDIAKLLETTQYERAHDRPAMHLEASAFFGKGLVVLTNRTMQQVWLIAYLTWRTLHEQSGFVVVSLIKNLPYDVRGHEHDQFTANVDHLGRAPNCGMRVRMGTYAISRGLQTFRSSTPIYRAFATRKIARHMNSHVSHVPSCFCMKPIMPKNACAVNRKAASAKRWNAIGLPSISYSVGAASTPS